MGKNIKTYSLLLKSLKKDFLIFTGIFVLLWTASFLFISNFYINLSLFALIVLSMAYKMNEKTKLLEKYSEDIKNSIIVEDDIRELTDTLEKSMEKGYFEVLDLEGKGDVSRIVNAFNYLIENTDSFISKLDNISEETFSSSRNLSEVAEQTAVSMKSVNNTLLELTSTTQQLTSSISDISDGANDVNALAYDGTEQLKSMDKQMNDIIISAREAGERIKEFKNSSDEINNILSVIKNIADQTNLLALNAAIEAARAGEHGRGFNVVADEIRELSQDTQDSLEAVSNIVDNIRTETTKTVEIINANNLKIESGEEILQETSEKFDVIARKIEDMVSQINEVASASQEITAGSEEISSLTEAQAEASNEFTDLAKELAEMAADLKDTLASTSIGAMKLDIDLEKFDKEMEKITADDEHELIEELSLSNKFVITMVARLEAVKGHEFFFEALENILSKYQEVICLLVGDGSLELELKEILAKKGINDRVLMLGYRGDINLILKVSDLVVLTSRKEGMPPGILLEAMAAKKAIVATDVTGNKNLVTNDSNGFLVEYNDKAALEEKIEFFVNEPQNTEIFGRQGREKLEELLA